MCLDTDLDTVYAQFITYTLYEVVKKLVMNMYAYG